ncbi:serine/arginine repetitive matrix protein 2-like [Dermacentor silvarum]|uniref:serine/arginine repetitive matrix protein 2-like n=1 Tax=Dermacentor silvarum TaxID=543639 RepID=UPI002100DF46|nr:serine/arginine repetitive matrix protein 2-like [Dermacentor silvarum]
MWVTFYLARREDRRLITGYDLEGSKHARLALRPSAAVPPRSPDEEVFVPDLSFSSTPSTGLLRVTTSVPTMQQQCATDSSKTQDATQKDSPLRDVNVNLSAIVPTDTGDPMDVQPSGGSTNAAKRGPPVNVLQQDAIVSEQPAKKGGPQVRPSRSREQKRQESDAGRSRSRSLSYPPLPTRQRSNSRPRSTQQDKLASPAAGQEDEPAGVAQSVPEGSVHQVTTKAHKKGKRHGHKEAGQSPPASKKSHHRRKQESEVGTHVTNGQHSPFSPGGEEHLGELEHSNEAAARIDGAAEAGSGKDEAVVSPVSPTSGPAAPTQTAQAKGTETADASVTGVGIGRTKKKHGKKKRGKGGEVEAPSPAPVLSSSSLLSPQSPDEQGAQQSGISRPLSEEFSPPKDPLSSPEAPAQRSTDQPTSTSGPLSPPEAAAKEAGEEISMQPGEVLIPRDTMPSDIQGSTAPREEAADEVAARERREHLCGVRGFYPDFLQKYRTPRCALTVLCLVSFTRSFSMAGVMMVVLPTLERRYQLKGYESGMILSSNDVASCLTMLPVAFLATSRNKPLFIGYGIVTMGLGNFVVAMVHFLSPSYQLSSAGSDLCPMMDIGSSCAKSGSIRCVVQ